MEHSLTDLKLIDLKRPEHSGWKASFFQLIDEIQERSTDRLKQNYLNLKDTFSQFETFNLVVDEDEILGFSGLQCHTYPPGIGRVLSRFYYTKAARARSLKGQPFPSYGTFHMLPYQLQKAHQLNLNLVFISMEGARRNYIRSLADSLNRYYNQDWRLEPGLWNTCRLLPNGKPNPSSACWQHAIVYRLKPEAAFELPHRD